MPSSEARAEAPADPSRWPRCLAIAAVTLALCLAVVAARVVWFDAYWLYRQTPPWLAETGGSNRLLDRQTRRGKTLQALARTYSVALVGSSTVYSGLDPRDADPAWRGRIFNVGISALLADELPVVASLLASRGEVERVVLGLDYYMFSRADRVAPLDRSLSGPTGRWNARLGSLWSRYALFDSARSEVAGSSDPGFWTYDGFRSVPRLSPELTRENDAVRRRTTAAFRPETLAALDLTLARLAPRRVDVYLAPVSSAQRRVMADLGLLDDLALWRRTLAERVFGQGVRFVDLVDLGSPFPFDPAEGSTEAWLDNLHFTPVIGRKVLAAVGLRSDVGP